MRQNFKRRLRTRSSKRTCEEKFCCPFIDSEAKYYCQDCKTAQCQACESSLHKTKVKYDFHCRKPIAAVSEASLCQAKKVNLVCQERNYPDLWCEQCQLPLCFTCFDTYHAPDKRRQHINFSIAHHLKKQEKEQQEQAEIELFESLEFYHDAVADINPQAPFSLAAENDSVTFCSFPQELNSLEDELQFASVASFHDDDNNTASAELCQGAAFSNAQEQVTKEDIDVTELPNSFLLIDDQEVLTVTSEGDFITTLGCDRTDTFKVVSIFGSTVDTKFHTLNHTFFRGLDVFQTSTYSTGVWYSTDKLHKLVVMDTKGLLDSASHDENGDSQLLLKVLATSDVVIYHARDEHLPKDMAVCLNNISKAYLQHFQQELQTASKQYGISESELGPSLVVFHETVNTDVLDKQGAFTDATLRQMFGSYNCPLEAFSKISYVGMKTVTSPAELSRLEQTVLAETEDLSVRTSRRPEVIFRSLKAIDEKFSQKMSLQPHIFTDQRFSCTSRCLACKAQCILNMNHNSGTELHDAGRDRQCEYHSDYGNKVFLCKMCLSSNKQVVVVPKTSSSSDTSWIGLTKYIWAGYVYECQNCGVIHRSREHWYGNEDDEKVLQVQFRHIWPQGPIALDGTHNAAWKFLEGCHYVADTFSSVSARPAKCLAEWTADKINPSYWMPNSEIINCYKCQLLFDSTEQKHHCRACGKGFCADCSSNKRPVPERGWGSEPVRVCDVCFTKPDTDTNSDVAVEQADLTARKVGEAVSSTLSAVVSAFDYSIGMIKNSAKPAYWVPDEQTKECCVCQNKFGPRRHIHHCRACGQGVCKGCSPNKCSVPLRGWDYPVRVCLKCEQKELKM